MQYEGGVWWRIFYHRSSSFGYSCIHSKFQNRSTFPSGRKVITWKERRPRKFSGHTFPKPTLVPISLKKKTTAPKKWRRPHTKIKTTSHKNKDNLKNKDDLKRKMTSIKIKFIISELTKYKYAILDVWIQSNGGGRGQHFWKCLKFQMSQVSYGGGGPPYLGHCPKFSRFSILTPPHMLTTEVLVKSEIERNIFI